MATEQQVEQAKAEIARVLDGVPKETAASALQKVAKMFDLDDIGKHAVLDSELARNQAIIEDCDARVQENKRKKAAVEQLRGWPKETRLERNDCSRLHRLKEAALNGRLIDVDRIDRDASNQIGRIEHTFVVKHDWANAFSNAPDAIGEFHIPFPSCTFEFRTDGHTVILWVQETETELGFVAFIESQDHWWVPPESMKDGVLRFLWNQVRAICIALDAEVATHSVIRAPHKLNEKRERAGKPKVIDYHVIDLSRRHRVAGASGSSTGRHVRLHFRRGHWRHFETTKTWIKWCLVGDPDLGFIQKHYSL